MMLASCVWLLFQKPDAILATSLNAVTESLLLAVTLAGIYIFWMAVAEIATRSGLIQKIAKFLKKPINLNNCDIIGIFNLLLYLTKNKRITYT